MKKINEEQIKKKLLKLGEKNIILKYFTYFTFIITVNFFRLVKYINANSKRLAMIAMTFFLFAAYSSFSLPIFSNEAEEKVIGVNGYNLEEDLEAISFAKETEVNLEEMEILDDNDVLDGYEDAEFHGFNEVDKYAIDEILESNEMHINFQSNNKAQKDPVGHQPTGFSKDDWKLVLINKQHPVPEHYEFTLGTIKGKMQCDERIIEDLWSMLHGAKKDGVNLVICSPYRDMERQEMLFNRKVTRYMNKGMSYMDAYKLAGQTVTVPGASEHQIGLALDIVSDSYTELDAGFGDTQAGKWLVKNCAKYGFILRYPKGKEYITGIEYEPWHFRYVGTDAATVIMDSGITLEEFWEDL